ncbi:hypothetical protein AALO_G00295670 [Alosa alosa]|uniref:Uncharacterized protein n=1 Tax=Alosa alosa TaxID=278164 RepID=A0AAV6FDF7_9TELE|nr:hypothetical protein AALO_G00295670 [Alosa alosa]
MLTGLVSDQLTEGSPFYKQLEDSNVTVHSAASSWEFIATRKPTSSTVRRGRCSIPSSSFSFTGGDKLEKHNRMLSITDTVSNEAMLGGAQSSSVEPSLL